MHDGNTGHVLQVLLCYKNLFRAAQATFSGDQLALADVRCKIREEFSKSRDVSDDGAITKVSVSQLSQACFDCHNDALVTGGGKSCRRMDQNKCDSSKT